MKKLNKMGKSELTDLLNHLVKKQDSYGTQSKRWYQLESRINDAKQWLGKVLDKEKLKLDREEL